ncbi:MAG: phosphoribosylformylglycinamidine synthase I [Anaerolineales bacterium]|jgi:phosphoribosylformylglycinamidine synthase|nr:phosphoribosylformylglycinamidine synthase I [Anaerolineales bacterium]HJO32953.1 phosphoribosylformylglycinamidine synthase I [Anaerolineales bacterium]|tara:strand:- start:77 stop:862 length:786 start_codon:yes stop_codon:yes gene_type:complete
MIEKNRVRALVLHASGTNRDRDAAEALVLAGAEPDIVHINQLLNSERRLKDYRLLVIPGGFSYGDALGAGRLLGLDMRLFFANELREFVEKGWPVIGICNGFQSLVRAGMLLGDGTGLSGTLLHNASGHFECRWVTLAVKSNTCVWTNGMTEPMYCPVAHGEGRFALGNGSALQELREHDQIALVYAQPDGSPARGEYPRNPNGSLADIAGICNRAGNVLGLMPHPENHVHRFQHPRWTRSEGGGLGLTLFVNGVKYAEKL